MLKIIALISEHGCIEGRTRFQKLVFLLEREFKVDFAFDFTPYYYGPYSHDLAEYLGSMVSSGLVREKRTPLGRYIDRYDYELTTRGQEIAEETKSSESKSGEFKRISKAVAELKNQDTSRLVREAKKRMAGLLHT
jgi:hypothetical protein